MGMIMVGCDVSKATLNAAWFDDARQRWEQHAAFANNGRGWRLLLAWLEKSTGQGRRALTLVIEATGVYHLPLAQFASRQGLRVIVTNPGRAAENARSHNRLHKSDPLDARGLAQYGRELENPHEYVPDAPEISRLKALLSRLRQLDTDLQRERNRLEKCPYIPESAALAASLRRGIKERQREQKLIQGEINALIRSHAELNHLNRLLCSIQGVGTITSQWLLPLLYRRQFASARQLAAFLGLTPIKRSSGTSLRKRGRLSGLGNPYLRSRLYMPAVSAITHNPELKAFYGRLLHRGKTPKQALTAVMRKLVHVAYGVVKNDAPYRCPIAA
jgi:transposase